MRTRTRAQVAVSSGGGNISLLSVAEGSLHECCTLQVGAEVACMDMTPMGEYTGPGNAAAAAAVAAAASAVAAAAATHTAAAAADAAPQIIGGEVWAHYSVPLLGPLLGPIIGVRWGSMLMECCNLQVGGHDTCLWVSAQALGLLQLLLLLLRPSM